VGNLLKRSPTLNFSKKKKKGHLTQSWLPTLYNVCVLTATCALTVPTSLDLKSRYRNQRLNKVRMQGTIQAIFITYAKDGPGPT
jgi:hypothetical protein